MRFGFFLVLKLFRKVDVIAHTLGLFTLIHGVKYFFDVDFHYSIVFSRVVGRLLGSNIALRNCVDDVHALLLWSFL